MMRRLVIVSAFLLVFGALITYKLFQIQWVEKESKNMFGHLVGGRDKNC